MRIGGAFPISQQLIAVPLAGGGTYYPPAGNYAASMGSQTILQSFDPVSLAWRSVAPGDAATYVTFDTDGYNWRFVNMSGVINGATITNVGSGATNGIGSAATGVAISFGAAPSNGRVCAAYPIVGGAINSTITITNGGSGFTVAPMLLIDPPPIGGIQATAVCTISGGIINAVTVTNAGAGYTSVPNVYVLPQFTSYPGAQIPVGVAAASQVPSGLVAAPLSPQNSTGVTPASTGGAQLTINATLAGSGTLTGMVMTDYGQGYTGTTIPTITITGAGAAAATAVASMTLTSVTLGSGGAGFGSGSPPNWETSLGLVVGSFNNQLYQPRPARGVTTVSAGAVATFAVEDGGFGLQKVPVVSVLNTSAIATGVATGTAVIGGVNDVTLLQLAINS